MEKNTPKPEFMKAAGEIASEILMEFNLHHDERGKFASAANDQGGGTGDKKQAAADRKLAVRAELSKLAMAKEATRKMTKERLRFFQGEAERRGKATGQTYAVVRARDGLVTITPRAQMTHGDKEITQADESAGVIGKSPIFEFNPHHDERGRFASAGGGESGEQARAERAAARSSADSGKAMAGRAGHGKFHAKLTERGFKHKDTVGGGLRAMSTYEHPGRPGDVISVHGRGYGQEPKWLHTRAGTQSAAPKLIGAGTGHEPLAGHLYTHNYPNASARPNTYTSYDAKGRLQKVTVPGATATPEPDKPRTGKGGVKEYPAYTRKGQKVWVTIPED